MIRSLKTCLNHGDSLDSVLALLQKMVPESPKKKDKPKKPKPTKPTSDNDVKFWKGYPYRVDQNGWWTWISNDQIPKSNAPSQPANAAALKPTVNPSLAKSPQERNRTWITSLRLEDWDQDPRPKLIPFPKIKQQLRNEQTVDGNVTEIWTCKEMEELSLLWKSFDDPAPLTALLFGNAKDYPAVLHTRINTTRGYQGPQTEHVALFQVSGKRSPWIHKSTKVAQDKLPKIERTGVRICAPSEFRGPYLPEGCTQDTPVSVIQALATATQGKVTDFTGGNWSQENRSGITQVIGFLKIKPSLANHLVANSGKFGLFASKIGEPRVTQARPFWVNRHENEPSQSYHQRVLQLQGIRSQPILYRFGKGHCLGFPRKADDQDPQKIKHVTISGVPRAWNPDDVQAFLADNGWKDLESSHKKGKIWFFKGQPPENLTNQTIWRFEIDENWFIEVQVASRPKSPIDKQQLRPPRTLAAFMGKGETRKSEESGQRPPNHAHRAVAAEPITTLRAPALSQNNADHMETEQLEARGHGSRSPRRADRSQTVPTALDPPSPDPTQQATKKAKLSPSKSFYPPCDPEDAIGKGWSLRDMGGEGDCFYRCAGTAVCKDPAKLTPEGAKIQGRFVRVKVVEHVRKHQERFLQIFPSEEKFQEWCEETAKSGTWVEGTALQAFSERYGVPVVIWSHKTNVWTRMVVAPRFSSGMACGSKDCVPLCLQLKDQHYQILTPPDQGKIPSSWLRETPNVVVDLRGAGRSVSSTSRSKVTKFSDACPTPSVHTMVSDTPVVSPGPCASSHLAVPVSPAVCASASVVSRFDPVTPSVHTLFSEAPGDDKVNPPSRPKSWHRMAVGQLWWSCHLCDYKIYKNDGVSTHSDSRRQHLIGKHGFTKDSVPALKKDRSKNVGAAFYSRMWKHLLDQCDKYAWPGMHQLVRNKKQGWRCDRCQSKRILSCQIPEQICPSFQGNNKSIPALATRKKLWKTWYKDAHKAAHVDPTEVSKKCKATRTEVKVAKQAKWDEAATKATVSSPRFSGLSLQESDRSKDTWWHCPFCDFKVAYGDRRRSDLKSRHLKNVHQSPNLSLNTHKNDALTNPQRLVKAQYAFDQRWLRFYAEIIDGPWPGSHKIEQKPSYFRQYKSKSGHTWQRAMYACTVCQMKVCMSDFPTSVCRLADEDPPSVTDRKAIWKTLRAKVKQRTKPAPKSHRKPKVTKDASCVKPKGSSVTSRALSKRADGETSTGRGLRGSRVGEASHPGPSDKKEPSKHPLSIWSVNISSWRKNGYAVLDQATTSKIDVLMLQETNVSDIACPSFANQVHRKGWQLVHVSPPEKDKKGGVAILTKDPCALVHIHTEASGKGQFAVAELLGLQRPVLLISMYRHSSDSEFQLLTSLSSVLEAHSGKDWIAGMDANASMIHGPIPEMFQFHYGQCGAHARHTREPIDGIWFSPSLVSLANDEIHSPSDHSIAAVTMDLTVHKYHGHHWRMSQVRKLRPDRGETHAVLKNDWLSTACPDDIWQQHLVDVDTAWQRWSSDAEAWLSNHDLLTIKNPERPLGSRPKLVPGAHQVAPSQSCAERQLRRHLRRLDEIQFISHSGRQIPPNLLRSVSRSVQPENERTALQQRRWGKARQLAHDRLQHTLRCEHQTALARWKERAHTIAGACRWLRQDLAAPYVIKSEDGQVISSKPRAVEMLRDYWQNIFGDAQHSQVDVEDFCNFYQNEFPNVDHFAPLPAIAMDDVKKVLRKMRGKSSGPDGWTADLLLCLPDQAITRLCDILTLCESSGTWPQNLTHWSVKFIPKKSASGVPSLGDVRPISIAPLLYRVWGSLRVRHVSADLARLFDRHQVLNVYECLLSLHQEYPESEFPYGLCLDFTKCFDSTDSALCVQLFRRMQVPPAICTLLASQWTTHTRWVCFGDTVSSRPVQHAQGLPQGDPWAPCALMLCLLLPLRRQHRLAPNSRCFLYLDDRTLVASSIADLQTALDTWNDFTARTRNRTNPIKTQVWARTIPAFVQLERAGFSPKLQVEVLGVTIGLEGRSASADEVKRQHKCLRLSRRLAVLPCPLRFKASIASLVLSPVVSWGSLLGGHVPTKSAVKSLHTSCRRAVKSRTGGHDSVHLQQMLLLGHCSDLLFVSVQRALRALHKWRDSHPLLPNLIQSSFLQCLGRAVGRLGGSVVSPGLYRFGAFTWDTTTPYAFVPTLAHNLRQFWRSSLLNRWLGSSRRDARIARSTNLRITDSLVHSLHTHSPHLNGDSLGIIVGGLHTDAHFRSNQSPLRDFCHDCAESVTPHTLHILYDCKRYDALRILPKPSCPLLQRLAWNQNGLDVNLATQLGKIRAEANRLSRLRRSSSAPPDSGAADWPPGGGGLTCEDFSNVSWAASARYAAASIIIIID